MKRVGCLWVLTAFAAAVAFAQSEVTLYTGIIRQVQREPPNVSVILESKHAHGTTGTYRLKGPDPNSLRREGVTRETFKSGSTLTLEVNEDHTSDTFGETIVVLPDSKRVRDFILE